jgi:hypothetical protein
MARIRADRLRAAVLRLLIRNPHGLGNANGCPLWVKSGHVQCKRACPPYLRNQTFGKVSDMPKSNIAWPRLNKISKTNLAGVNAYLIQSPLMRGHVNFGHVDYYSTTMASASRPTSFFYGKPVSERSGKKTPTA